MGEPTGFKDRADKDICLGDIVQHKLPGKGLPPKHGGATLYRVAKAHKKVRLISVDQEPETGTGAELTAQIAGSLVVIDRAH